MSTQPPALECSCSVCDIKGWKCLALDSTIYIFGIRALVGIDDQEAKNLRAEWKRSMTGIPFTQGMSTHPRALQYRDAKFRKAAGEASDFARTVSDAALRRAVNAGGVLWYRSILVFVLHMGFCQYALAFVPVAILNMCMLCC